MLPVVELTGKSVDAVNSVGADDAVEAVGVDDVDAVDAVEAVGVDDVDADVVMAGQESVLIAAPVADNDSSRKQYSSSSGSPMSLL